MSTDAPRLRGATVNPRGGPRPGTWRLFVVLVIVVMDFFNVLSWHNDNQRYQRLSAHGIATTIKIGNCTGNLGGSGSNGAGFTCTGTYLVRGQTKTETVAAQSTFLAPGSSLPGIVDPANTNFVIASAGLPTLQTSDVALWPSVLSLFPIGVMVLVWRRQRAGKPEPIVS